MPTFGILVFWDVLLVGRSEDFKNAKLGNNNTVETSNFAVDTLLIQCDNMTEESLHLY
jgi:hypothetical protein